METTVRLENDTCGKCKDGKVGQNRSISLYDENGMPIQKYGKIVEILEEREPWD